ncbi:hypothetical protein C427_1154 [Paraglaciecola psychrophila 170]|uniref:Uncharacterized protein n=1 Tax=Paraglaciecola psychrophila 170 TaxID=1129794 RepID=K7A8A5_9ALTE|nr:hypothetical protein C427_1154 [Paraglaciecola psychrophila 170]GAC36993.1 hypothetical protein GPSY_1358 [Paraglaciecola psychrophila 170]
MKQHTLKRTIKTLKRRDKALKNKPAKQNNDAIHSSFFTTIAT